MPHHILLIQETGLDLPPSNAISLDAIDQPRQILAAPKPQAWHRGWADSRKDETLVGQFERQAEQTPYKFAVIHEDEKLNYHDVNQRANRLAHYLRSSGVGPETLVGIGLPRSLDLLVSMLAVFKAGGAYVPLDPCYPAERLRHMLDDAGVRLLLTRTGLVAHAGKTVCLDAQADEINTHPADNPLNDTQPSHLAYVIYTSGSTGKPKGVMVEQGSLTSFVQAIGEAYAISAADRVLQFASPSFDVSIEEIFPCLCRGGTLVIRSEEMLDTVAKFVQKSRELALTVWDLPTAYWHQIVNELTRDQITLPPSLRLVVIGGEQANTNQVRQWQEKLGLHPQLINAYGPTETTVEASVYPVSSWLGENKQLPIGRPLSDARFYILDENLRPVADGEPGELYIGGSGLARGYLNSPELTAEKFIANPFASQTGERLYKTGDFARLRVDGNVEFLGRIDHQVKIQGFRIELGEIEAVLATHPQVADVAVIVREDYPGDKRLVAYVVAMPGLENVTGTLHSFLKDKLPHYMMPKVFVPLDTMPLTANDKLDRNALPAPDAGRLNLAERFIAPRSTTEERLAAIWAEVIGIGPIGVLDDFFMLGGHSLIAGQILSRVQTGFGLDLSFRDLLENSSLEAFAKVVEQRQPNPASEHEVRMVPMPREGDLPVSFAQERVHFIEELAPSMTAYQFQESLRFKGPLDIAVLERALGEIIRRHEIYRTTFQSANGKLAQVIHPAFAVELPAVDLSPLPEAQREAEAGRLRHEFVLLPFAISQLPLVRWQLIRLSETEHELVHVEHHMVHDGWSFNIFLREMLAIYTAFVQGRPSPFLAPPPQFADFAHWQRHWAEGETARAQLAFWTQKLAGSPPLLELPYDRPRPPEQSFRGGMERMELPLGLCKALRTFSAREKVTLFMGMTAAFLVLIHRYSGQDDLCIGSGVANRRALETEGLIGMVVNNIVLRTDLSGNPTFNDLLRQVRHVTLEAYDNEDLPFDKVVEALKPIRNLSYNPLFQVMFSFHDAQLPDLSKIPGVDVSLHETVSNHSAKFDLDVVVIPRSEQRLGQHSSKAAETQETDGITLVWEYSLDLFDPKTIRRMMDAYQTVLGDALQNLNAHLSELDVLTAQQKQQLLHDWNQTSAPYATGTGCIHQLFEAQVGKTPDAIAVLDGQRRLTYRELNRQANQLAHYLLASNIGTDVLVGLCVERSLEMVVSLLGILKAGGAYVPLDPSYPAERLSYMLDDAHVSVLLTNSKQDQITTQHPVQRICLDTDWETIAPCSADNPGVPVSAYHLAYVIYTSGSTGKPKGVMVEHASLVNFTLAAIDLYGIGPNDRVLQFASISFDAAAEEIYPCLGCGAKLILRQPDMLDSVAAFVGYSKDFGLTVWDLPTAYWHLLTQELADGNIGLPDSLRLVILGGERALPERIRQWLEKVGPMPKLLNSYGPTEATVVATAGDLTAPDVLLEGREAPIGRPIANVQTYILDSHGRPAPIGVSGELHIGGIGVARGYLNRPELTAEKFIADPFSENPAARLYKTGDLVRYRPDGNIEFLGRTDTQVKIRGLRIELGEIETALNQHPAVMQSVVTVREDTPGSKRLVAYLVAQRQTTLDNETLRQYLTQKLPVYMIPTAFVMLDDIPLSASGKIDTKALPPPEHSPAESGRGVPRNEIEEKLVATWSQVLGLASVSIHDNFFELGGDSIISIQMLSHANRTGLQFTPKQLFQNQTIAQLAAVVTQGGGRTTIANQSLATGDVPLTPIQHWFFKQHLPQAHFFNQSVLLELPTHVDADVLKQTLRRLLQQHDALRLRFTRSDDGWQQTHSALAGDIPFTVIELPAGTAEQQKSAIRQADAGLQASLDFSLGRIMLAALFVGGHAQSRHLLIVAHHLVVDAISWRILLEDLATVYQQLEGNEPVQLPAKTTSFQDWSLRLNRHAQSAEVIAELDYWGRTATVKAPQALPVDYNDADVFNNIRSADYVTLFLTEAETRALLQEVPAAYNTQINDVLLTALSLCIHGWTGQMALRVDLEGHGREDLFDDMDLSRTVGWLTSLYPVTLELPSTHPGEAMKAIKEQLRAVPKRGMGYGMLRYLNRDAEIHNYMSKLPEAELSFNYLGQFDHVTSASGDFANRAEWKSDASQQGQRSHVLAVSGLIGDNRLEIRWEYSKNLHRPDTIEKLAQDYLQALRKLILHCQSPGSGSYTPSDFSARSLSQNKLDKLVSKLKTKR